MVTPTIVRVWACVCVSFMTLVIDGRETSSSDDRALHVVGLVAAETVAEKYFLHSACRLKYPSVKMMRSWCPSGRYEEDSRLKDHLESLPEEDLVIVTNLRDEFVYLLASYDDVRRQLIDTDQSLIVADLSFIKTTEGERGGEEEEKRGEEEQEEEEKQEKEEKNGNRDEDNYKKEENERKEVEEPEDEGKTGNKNKTKKYKNEKKEEKKESKMIKMETGKSSDNISANEKHKINEVEGKNETHDPVDAGGERMEEEAERRKPVDEEEEKEEEKEEEEEEEKEEEEEEEEDNIVRRVLKGGTVIGRVGSLLKALREGSANTQEVIRDTTAQHVVYGNRQRGNLVTTLPLRVEFTPEGGAEGDVTRPFLVFNKEDGMDFYNLIEGVGEGREACPYTTHATPTYDEGRPRVLALLLLGGTWAPFLQEVLKGFAAQDYPKDRMDVWIHAKAGQQEREITNFVEEHGDDYSTLELVNDLVFEPQMVKDRCDAVRCAFLVMMEPQVVLEDPTTISSLIASDVSVVGPLLKRRMTGEGGEVNFVLSDDSGEQWDKIIRRRIFKGTLRVQEIRSFQVVRKDVMFDFLLGEKVDHYINTITQPGLYLDRLGYEEGKLHPDLWGLTHNWILWQRRYLHPDLLKIIGKKMVPETVGPYLYYLPFFSERFCQDIIEEVEHFGQWQDKDKDDREEEAHRYTSTNINLSQINYFTQYNLLINTVKKELLDTLYSYRSLGYGNLVFVLKYESTTHYNTFKYHLDGATYTFNIALNNNFTGGGLQYRMGNVNFGEEREIWVNHNRTGWALVQPDRPMHLHHGMPLKSGQRYALISIVDTSDAGCMGGPKWT